VTARESKIWINTFFLEKPKNLNTCVYIPFRIQRNAFMAFHSNVRKHDFTFRLFLNSNIWASLSLDLMFLYSRWFMLNVHSIVLL